MGAWAEGGDNAHLPGQLPLGPTAEMSDSEGSAHFSPLTSPFCFWKPHAARFGSRSLMLDASSLPSGPAGLEATSAQWRGTGSSARRGAGAPRRLAHHVGKQRQLLGASGGQTPVSGPVSQEIMPGGTCPASSRPAIAHVLPSPSGAAKEGAQTRIFQRTAGCSEGSSRRATVHAAAGSPGPVGDSKTRGGRSGHGRTPGLKAAWRVW